MSQNDHRHGLEFDLAALAAQRLRRRNMLSLMVGGSAAALLAMNNAAANAGELCLVDAETTNGPYPADGTNSAPGGTSNILAESGVLRTDIRSSFGSSSGVAGGVPLTLRIKLANASADCDPLPGAAIYVWHCTQDGLYSLYTAPEENYLRGVQIADGDGYVSFSTIFPGCYPGRWPHIHFEVYRSSEEAVDHKNAVLTSQFALPEDISRTVYAVEGYGDSLQHLAELTLATDNVFSRIRSEQITVMTPSVTGSSDAGYVADVTVAVNI